MICVKCQAEVPDAPFCGQCGWKQAKAPPVRHKRGNGQGRVWKRGSSWYAQVTLYSRSETRQDGSRHVVQKRRTRGGFETKKAALAALESLRGPQGRDCPKLLHYWELYERSALEKLSGEKQTAYRIARKRLDSLMGRTVDSLTVGDIQAAVDANASTYYTARDMRSLMSHLFKLAMADQFVSVNLSKFIVLPELEEKESEPFTDLEVQALWKSWSDGSAFAGYILLMIYSGMMPGELMACRVENIDLGACEIRGVGKKTKIRKETPIVYPDLLRPLVEDLAAAAGEGKLLKINKDNFYKKYYAALETAGVRKLPPYSCRHTTGTEAARANLTAPVIQKLMRHAKITTSQRYIHLAPEEAHNGINKVAEANSVANK